MSPEYAAQPLTLVEALSNVYADAAASAFRRLAAIPALSLPEAALAAIDAFVRLDDTTPLEAAAVCMAVLNEYHEALA